MSASEEGAFSIYRRKGGGEGFFEWKTNQGKTGILKSGARKYSIKRRAARQRSASKNGYGTVRENGEREFSQIP